MLLRARRRALLTFVFVALVRFVLTPANAFAASGEPKPSAEVVVVGGGPAGLAAAIEARLAGATSVLVLEKHAKERTRAQPLALFRPNLDNLARLGVRIEEGKNVTVIAGRRTLLRTKIDARKADHRVKGLDPSTAAVFMSIDTLENELKKAADRLGGISVEFGSEVTDVEPRAETPQAVVRRADGSVRRVTGRYVIVADGANSRTLAALGVHREPVSDKSLRVMAGVFNQKGTGKWAVVQGESGTLVRTGGLHEAVYAEVDPERRFASEAARNAWYRAQAKKVGVGGRMLIKPAEFDVHLDRVDRHAVGDSVFVIGDAARKTHFYSGQGANFALRDAERVGKLVGRLRANPGVTTQKADIRRFERETAAATKQTHDYVMRSYGFRPSNKGPGVRANARN